MPPPGLSLPLLCPVVAPMAVALQTVYVLGRSKSHCGREGVAVSRAVYAISEARPSGKR